MPRFSTFITAVIFCVVLSGPAGANGWEHGAIPFSALVGALSDEDPGLRYRAAQSLGYRGEKRAVAPLLQALERPQEIPSVRAAIFDALGRLGDDRAVPVLRECLTDDEREELRADCAEALGRVGEASSLDDLLTAYADDPSFLVKARIVEALGGFAAPPAVDLLARLAGDPRNQSLARRAVVALGRTGAPQAIPVLLDLLGKARDDRERLAIVEALGNLRATEAADVLAELADGASDPRLRITAVIALGTIRDGGSLPVLTRLLDDPLPAVRLTTIRALAALGDPRATASIAALVRREADALAKRDDVALFADPSTALAGLAVQLDGLRTLADLDAPAAVDAILAATTRRKLPADSATALRLAEGFYEVRRQAIYALGYTKSDRAKAYLAGPEGLGDPDPRIRLVAVRARGVLGGSGALAEITPHLDDPSTDVRRMAAIVAGRLGDAAAVPLLVKALEDPIPQVRREAALGLAFLDAAEAREALARTAQSDSDEEVKAAARFALKRLDKPGSVE